MSSDAIGWVYRHSPYRGVEFAVHHAIADSVNDQHGYELWMRQSVLAGKARTTRRSVLAALATLTDGGFLDLLEEGRGGANRYRFLMPEGTPVVYETRPEGVKRVHTPVNGDHTVTGVRCEESSQGGVKPVHTKPKEEPKDTSFSSDVHRLCGLLADLIAEDGTDRPDVSARWLTDCERLMRLDKKTPEQVERAIRWSQADPFWSTVVLSPASLRKNYLKLSKAAKQPARNGQHVATKVIRYEEPTAQ